MGEHLHEDEYHDIDAGQYEEHADHAQKEDAGYVHEEHADHVHEDHAEHTHEEHAGHAHTEHAEHTHGHHVHHHHHHGESCECGHDHHHRHHHEDESYECCHEHEHGHHHGHYHEDCDDDGCGCHHHHDDGCGCHHHHHHDDGCGCHHHHHGDEDEGRTKLMRIIASAILLVVAIILDRRFSLAPAWALLVYLVPYLVAGYDVLLEAWEGIREGHPFDEDFLMAVATIGALVIGFVPGGEPEFAEAVFVMLFFQVGELFEDAAQERSRASIAELMDIRPDVAHVERSGELITVNPSEVNPDEIVVIRPGERIPMDGVVIEGSSNLDTVALTGESVPRVTSPGDDVFSGCVNQTGVLRVRVTRRFEESTASRILELVEHSSGNKSRSENFIRRFARRYTPAVVFAAIALALIGPLFSGNYAANFATWLLRALTFLVVSCPCALVISVPLTFFGGIGGASRHGILIKGSNHMEALAQANTVVFDKTGTLTQGVFQVNAVHGVGCEEHKDCEEEHRECSACEESRKRLLHLAAHVERYSTHPIAEALRKAYPDEDDDCTVDNIQEVAGQGVIAQVNGQRVAVGNTRLMESEGASWQACQHEGTVIHVAIGGVYAGHIVISDEIKDDAAAAIAALKTEGVSRVVMLTGDRANVAQAVAKRLGVDEVRAELLPEGKVEAVEELLKTSADGRTGRTLAFVGDGINDAPVLARADVGIAMGALGSDAAIEAADVVLMDDAPSKVACAMRIARRTLSIARQNIVFAITVKIAILVLAALGLAPMWLAVFGDVGVMVLAVLNATRALHS